MKSYEWDKTNQAFIEVDDPTYHPDLSTVVECVTKAGYFQELSSYDEGEGAGGFITVYATEDKTKPRFYIDVMGQNTGIATLVARDFIGLLETLRQLHPLLTLIGLDQFSTARVSDHLE